MNILSTPGDRFENLPDYPFAPHYLTVAEGVNMHYVDEGPNNGQVVLLLHGEPSWSFLYRTMIPVLAEAGYRVIAPDLIGFGKSDKPTERSDYTYLRHVDWTKALVTGLDLNGIHLFCQDWGGLIGLRIAAEMEERFASIVAANTFLPIGNRPASEAFLQWLDYSQNAPRLSIGKIIQASTTTDLSKEVQNAYWAPFPDDTYMAGARIFPALVPISTDNPAVPANLAAWEVLKKWEKPFLTLFSDKDPITRGGERAFQKLIPGAQGQPHTTIENAGHFLQEDKGPEIARIMLDWFKRL